MKNITQKSVRILALGLVLGVASLCAQSCAATRQFGTASKHAVNASGEIAASGAASVAGTAHLASGAIAVPVFASGAVVQGSGEVAKAMGDLVASGGQQVTKGAEKLWDFSNGDPAERPALDRSKAVPAPTTKALPAKDPSPADAMKKL